MKLNNVNNNAKLVKKHSLLFTRENFIIFSFLTLFTALTTVLITLSFDLLFDNFNLIEKDIFLIAFRDNQINDKVASLISVKQDLSHNDKISIFNPFIDLFDKTHSTHKHFPSYFQIAVSNKDYIMVNNTIVSSSINKVMVDTQNSNIIEKLINYNQYLILEQHSSCLNDLLLDICKLILEYKQYNNI